MVKNKILDLNLEKKYIIFSDNPKKKILISEGDIKIDLNKNILKLQYKLKK